MDIEVENKIRELETKINNLKREFKEIKNKLLQKEILNREDYDYFSANIGGTIGD